MNKVIAAVSRKTDNAVAGTATYSAEHEVPGLVWVCGHFYDRKWADQGDQHPANAEPGVIAVFTPKRPPRAKQQFMKSENL